MISSLDVVLGHEFLGQVFDVIALVIVFGKFKPFPQNLAGAIAKGTAQNVDLIALVIDVKFFFHRIADEAKDIGEGVAHRGLTGMRDT